MEEQDKIRVLAVCHTGLLGGAERSLLELLDRDQASGATTAAIACPPGELADAAAAAGITALPISSFEFGFNASKSALPSVLFGLARASISVFKASRRFKPDVIHANSPRATMISGLATALGRVPMVTHLRDVTPTSRQGNLTRRIVSILSQRVVANSKFTAVDFRQGSGPQIDVVYNLLGAEFVQPDATRADAFRSELNLGDAPLIGIVGQLTPWKGHDLAIRAFAEARRSGADMKLVIVGSTKFATVGSSFENAGYEERLREIVKELGVENHVVFAGQLSSVSGPMQAFEITLMPSHAEPFGRAAIEAMACGSAVIATNVGGPIEFIEDGETGLLRGPDSQDEWSLAIQLLANDRALRSKLASNGRAEVVRRFATYSPETQMVPIYKELAGG